MEEKDRIEVQVGDLIDLQDEFAECYFKMTVLNDRLQIIEDRTAETQQGLGEISNEIWEDLSNTRNRLEAIRKEG